MHNKVTAGFISLVLVVCFSGQALADREIKPTRKDKCPVCGMFVSPYANWVAAIEFTDGSLNFFDGSKDMFKYLFFMDKYNKQKTRKDVANIYVTEFYSTKLMPAKELYFISGSNVMGPMGKELIPVKGKKNAETFLKDHHGERIITFESVRPEDLPKMKM